MPPATGYEVGINTTGVLVGKASSIGVGVAAGINLLSSAKARLREVIILLKFIVAWF